MGGGIPCDIIFCISEFSSFSSINIHNPYNEGKRLFYKNVNVDFPDPGN